MKDKQAGADADVYQYTLLHIFRESEGDLLDNSGMSISYCEGTAHSLPLVGSPRFADADADAVADADDTIYDIDADNTTSYTVADADATSNTDVGDTTSDTDADDGDASSNTDADADPRFSRGCRPLSAPPGKPNLLDSSSPLPPDSPRVTQQLPPDSPRVLEVVEKSESVSWKLEYQEGQEAFPLLSSPGGIRKLSPQSPLTLRRVVSAGLMTR